MQGRHEGGATGAIHQGVVHFGIDREAAFGQIGYVVQALDNIGLPQGAGHIQRTRMQASGLYTQLTPVSWFRQGDVAQVKLHVEVSVFYPVRAIQSSRDFYQAGTEQGHISQTSLKTGDDVLEADKTARSRRRIINAHAAHMLGGIGLFQVDKGGV